jgi:hypothetical protein
MTCELEVGRAARYSQVLTPAERETIRLRRHKVVDKVRLPAVAEQFHRTAESAGDPRDDTWLLLMDEDDARYWLFMLAGLIPDIVARIGGRPELRREFVPLVSDGAPLRRA